MRGEERRERKKERKKKKRRGDFKETFREREERCLERATRADEELLGGDALIEFID